MRRLSTGCLSSWPLSIQVNAPAVPDINNGPGCRLNWPNKKRDEDEMLKICVFAEIVIFLMIVVLRQMAI